MLQFQEIGVGGLILPAYQNCSKISRSPHFPVADMHQHSADIPIRQAEFPSRCHGCEETLVILHLRGNHELLYFCGEDRLLQLPNGWIAQVCCVHQVKW